MFLSKTRLVLIFLLMAALITSICATVQADACSWVKEELDDVNFTIGWLDDSIEHLEEQLEQHWTALVVYIQQENSERIRQVLRRIAKISSRIRLHEGWRNDALQLKSALESLSVQLGCSGV